MVALEAVGDVSPFSLGCYAFWIIACCHALMLRIGWQVSQAMHVVQSVAFGLVPEAIAVAMGIFQACPSRSRDRGTAVRGAGQEDAQPGTPILVPVQAHTQKHTNPQAHKRSIDLVGVDRVFPVPQQASGVIVVERCRQCSCERGNLLWLNAPHKHAMHTQTAHARCGRKTASWRSYRSVTLSEWLLRCWCFPPRWESANAAQSCTVQEDGP